MARGTRSASLRRIGTPEELAERQKGTERIIQRITSYKRERTMEIEGSERTLRTNFPVAELRRRRNYATGKSNSEVHGVLIWDFPLEIDTREGRRTIIAMSQAAFTLRLETAVAVYFGVSAGAGNFAVSITDALLDDPEKCKPVMLSSDELKEIRRRALNIRLVGYRNNPDLYVQKMSYSGTHVDESPDVLKADGQAELHRIMVEIETSGGKRTIQIMGSGGILGYGVDSEDIEDIVDIIEQILYGP